jgi:hypothetical protein
MPMVAHREDPQRNQTFTDVVLYTFSSPQTGDSYVAQAGLKLKILLL